MGRTGFQEHKVMLFLDKDLYMVRCEKATAFKRVDESHKSTPLNSSNVYIANGDKHMINKVCATCGRSETCTEYKHLLGTNCERKAAIYKEMFAIENADTDVYVRKAHEKKLEAIIKNENWKTALEEL